MDYIGIDISKDTFHVAWNDVAEVSVFANDNEGIDSFEDSLHHRQFQKEHTKIGLESTGIYHLLLCVLLTDHGWDVNVINPYITSKAIHATGVCTLDQCLQHLVGGYRALRFQILA